MYKRINEKVMTFHIQMSKVCITSLCKRNIQRKKKDQQKTKQNPEQDKSPTFLASVQYQDSVLRNRARD